MVRKLSAGLIAALGLVLGVASTCRAAPFTWEIEGQVEQILSCSATCDPVDRPELTSLGVMVGAPLRATYVLESGAPDMDALPDYGRYVAILSASFQVAGYSVSATEFPGGADLVVNVPDQAMLLLVSHGGTGPSTLSNPIVGLEVLADVPGTFASDALPLAPPNLGALHPYDPNDPNFGFGTSFAVLYDGVQIRSSISSWTLVPEPSVFALSLLGIALVRVAARGFRSA
ncbi:MAG: hypothetical protein FJ108_16280 [Deltaproteobacteria bacterium]|nr:hypothetical protein [Deltaproteobacteria bacterium]